MSTDKRVNDRDIRLPSLPAPAGKYVHAVRTGTLLFLSGKGPYTPDGKPPAVGKVGAEISVNDAYHHARFAGLTLISAMKETLGSLDAVAQIVKVFGMVNAVPEFTEHSTVIDGCSDVFGEVFGDAGSHSRSAVGVTSLPNGITVHIECIVEINKDR